MSNLKLSKQGEELIVFYKEMVCSGLQRNDEKQVAAENVYNSFQLKKFRNLCKNHISNSNIKTVLDYGGGGSDWDAPNFEETSGESAKQFFNVKKVTTFEPARNLIEKQESDCVVCIDVLEHIFITDVPKLINELFSLSKKLLVINVACYEAAALLPNGENAHITVRSPHWWKGMCDAVAMNYPDIEVFLICSENFKKGVAFKPFKSKNWNTSNEYLIECHWGTLQ